MMREAKTNSEQQRLAREKELRDANAAIMIAKMWRGAKTRGAFERELKQEPKATVVSEAEIARIVGDMLILTMNNVAEEIPSFLHFTPDDVMEVMWHMIGEIHALESA